ncbi:MAG: DUF4398 domain-containing protein [Pseudomonadota bacterium]|uniref:DUF4398 domain-containing protein n=1 Tax=Candidatus Desulfatibia profunda TaxID=2841695 RepID=A0A8J6NLF2_9BACT|nr:DUF4398 domain-containing protein [Candidatus Desulfatibia profunda]MBL7178736.1 DUF4398 domain-containing protein [Desulfobacterales bacterium]
MAVKKSICLGVVCGLLLIFSFAEPIRGQDLSAAQEQEYLDAQKALKAARNAQAEKYSADNLKKAEDFLSQADSIRTLKDKSEFAQASHLARVYAELAEALAELKAEEEKLAATNEELLKIKDEIERLKEGQ